MKRVFLYNPENDIALGAGVGRFTPPKNAALLSRYGAPLMWWLGDADDYVVVPPELVAEQGGRLVQWQRQTVNRFGRGPELVTDVRGLHPESLSPWGWSMHAFQRLESVGVPKGPLEKWTLRLDAIRHLSHRRTAMEINRRLGLTVDFGAYNQQAPVPAVEAYEITGIESFARNHERFYFKSPWSSSGRGVERGDRLSAPQLLTRCNGIIRRQGSVMLEPAYDKADDFAMLFEATQGRVRFHGYSLFFNAHGAAYGGNVIADDHSIRAYLTQKIDGRLLDDVRDSLEVILSEIIGNVYDGFLGVDMMVVREAEGFALVPCVEMNLRMTMGVVAHAVKERIGSEDGLWLMKVIPGGRGEVSEGAVSLVPQNGVFDIVVEKSAGKWADGVS